jgi:hypothetical protein
MTLEPGDLLKTNETALALCGADYYFLIIDDETAMYMALSRSHKWTTIPLAYIESYDSQDYLTKIA